jgi:predicted ester cyclase
VPLAAQARHTGDFAGFPATGKQIEVPGMSLWEFDHGKARRGWGVLDLASLLAQLQG